jgi:hypothetical protein
VHSKMAFLTIRSPSSTFRSCTILSI